MVAGGQTGAVEVQGKPDKVAQPLAVVVPDPPSSVKVRRAV